MSTPETSEYEGWSLSRYGAVILGGESRTWWVREGASAAGSPEWRDPPRLASRRGNREVLPWVASH